MDSDNFRETVLANEGKYVEVVYKSNHKTGLYLITELEHSEGVAECLKIDPTILEPYPNLCWIYAHNIESMRSFEIDRSDCGDRFIVDLAHIPWFASVGTQLDYDGQQRILSWSSWPGPSSIHDKVTGFSHMLQTFFLTEERFKSASESVAETIDAAVAQLLETLTPPAKDVCLYAIEHAKLVASLVVCHIYLGMRIQSQLKSDWTWFRLGHWACSTENVVY